jgi:hypothetical protein
MTIEEIRAAWLRWMHRNDLEADLATVETMAHERIAERLMYATDGVEPWPPAPETAPRLWLHAGLVSLHQLAQDDEGLMREQELFERAAVDWHFRRSFETLPLPTIGAA